MIVGVERIVPNRFAGAADNGRGFFTDVLGLDVAMELPFITTYRGGSPEAQISVLSEDPSGLKPDYSVGVDNVEAIHARAIEQGCKIVYPLTDEPWGVRRFFVRDPLGGLANVVEHRTQSNG